MTRRQRFASHGPWLAHYRSSCARWVRGPGDAVAWAEALRRLPSLARLDNAGEFGRMVLRSMLNRSMYMRWSRDPRSRRWLQRMTAAGIVEVHPGGAPWCLAEELRLLIPEDA